MNTINIKVKSNIKSIKIKSCEYYYHPEDHTLLGKEKRNKSSFSSLNDFQVLEGSSLIDN